ncbi:UNVERIFIED_CONTAM: hypothetical protein FKN15_021163 [Acipenser sinensis]
MEESEEKLQETPDELHKIQEVHGERGFSTQVDHQKEDGPLEDVMEKSEEKVQETPDPFHKIQEVHGERGFSTQEDSEKEELDHRLKMEVASQNISPPPWEFVEVQPSPSVKEKGEEEERVSPAPMFSQPESTKLPRGAEDEDNAMVHRKRKLGSTRKGQRRMQILEGQLVGEEGPPGAVMEESEEKLQETPDELHKIQEVQEKRGFSTQGDSQKAEGHLEDVMEESEEKVLQTPAELHENQEVHGERGFSTQGDSQKEELDQWLETEVAGQNISPSQGEFVEVQPSPSVKEKGEEEERVSPAPMLSHPQSTEPPRGAEDEDNAMEFSLCSIASDRTAFMCVLSPSPGEFLAGQPSASVKEEERVTPAPMLCQPQSTKDKDSTVTDRKRKLGSSRRGPKRLQNLGSRQGEQRAGQETTNALCKIQKLFQGSDGEGTGIITRAEMQEVCGDLPLTLEELDQVFDRLDREGSGYITSEDLSAALSEYEGSIPGTLRSG